MKTGSERIHHREPARSAECLTSTRPPMMLVVPLERGLGRENLILSSGSRSRLVFLSRIQTLNRHKRHLKTEKELFAGKSRDPPHVHCLRPLETRYTCGAASRRRETIFVLDSRERKQMGTRLKSAVFHRSRGLCPRALKHPF
jgi:hypothetical protein